MISIREKISQKLSAPFADPYRSVRISLFVVSILWGAWAIYNWPFMQGIISASIGGACLITGVVWIIKRHVILKKFLNSPDPFKNLLNSPDEDGDTPLHLAYYSKDKELIRDLIRKGASPNIYDEDGNSIKNDILKLIEEEPPRKKEIFVPDEGPHVSFDSLD